MLSFVIRGHQRDTGRGRGISSSFYCALHCLSVVVANQAQEFHRGTHLPLSFSSTRMSGFLMSSAGILPTSSESHRCPAVRSNILMISCVCVCVCVCLCVCVALLCTHFPHDHSAPMKAPWMSLQQGEPRGRISGSGFLPQREIDEGPETP